MPERIEAAKISLKEYVIKHDARFRGIPISSFDKEELLKILDMCAKLIKAKNRIINAHL